MRLANTRISIFFFQAHQELFSKIAQNLEEKIYHYLDIEFGDSWWKFQHIITGFEKNSQTFLF